MCGECSSGRPLCGRYGIYLHGLRIHAGLQGVIVVGQIWQLEGHGFQFNLSDARFGGGRIQLDIRGRLGLQYLTHTVWQGIEQQDVALNGRRAPLEARALLCCSGVFAQRLLP